MFVKKLIIGMLWTILGFIALLLISQNLVLAAISGVFMTWLYLGYLIAKRNDEVKSEKFCNISIRLAIIVGLISITEITLSKTGIHEGPVALALSWPLGIMAIIIFALSLFEGAGIMLVKFERFFS